MTQWSFLRTALLLCAGLVLACLPALCQVDTTATDTGGASGDDVQMRVPPPVSGQAYPTEYAGGTEQNYWRGGFTVSSGYSSNVTGGTNPVGDMSYSFWPSIALDRVTTQSHIVLSYSPGFTVYQKTSGYNQANQNLTANLQYRFSETLSISVREGFQQTSNIFDQPNPLSALPVFGSVPTSGIGVIAPFADQINNATAVQVTDQVGATSMLGVGGSFANQNYLNSEQASGLYNSRSEGASAFYSRRLGEKYYIGANYQFQNVLSYEGNASDTHIQTQTVSAFLSVYLRPRLSVSVSVGPQHYSATQPPFPAASSWSPLLTVSAGWQGERTAVAGSFSRIVSGAGGLNGVFQSTSVGASFNWKVSRNWNTGVAASYSNNTSVSPLFLSSSGGRTVLGTVSAQRALGEHATVQFGYSWTNQNYDQIAAIASAPNTNRFSVSLNYQFMKPLQK